MMKYQPRSSTSWRETSTRYGEMYAGMPGRMYGASRCHEYTSNMVKATPTARCSARCIGHTPRSIRKRRPSARRNGVNAAHSMELARLDAKIGTQLKFRPVRVSANPSVCVAMTATSAHTPKISASRRQVVKGVSGGSDIVSISKLRRRVAMSGGPLDRQVAQPYHDVPGSRD